ncbi:MAG: ATP phosphoribosyltransferase regulatory subunit, partial [bacterium]
MKNEKKIKPELLGGFRDYIPNVMLAKQEVLGTIRRTFEQFGFLPLDTPALERSSVLGTDTDEFKMEVYRFMAGDQDVTLRFDLTVPLARVVAAYPEILKPFKRYQCGLVWRKEKPQAGRFREFTQFDADIVGSDSILADAEIISLMYTTMKNLGLDNFLIRFNNRKILNGLPEVAGFEKKKAASVFRVLDK